MPLARWHTLLETYPHLQQLSKHVNVVYDIYVPKPRYKLSNPRDFQAWAESAPGYDSVDLQRLEILVFQDITRE